MCGITGFYSPKGGNEQWAMILQRMTDAIRHRGPDDEGHWGDLEAGIALGHRRLSIIDLSPLGHQPMFSGSGRYGIVYNGEIYNYLDLRLELEALDNPRAFRGSSDTEVMLAAFEHWGVLPAVQRFIGMFAFALWDRQERHLYLARDRMGEKPLYYGWLGDCFVFGSELKALQQHSNWTGAINRDAIALLMRYMYIPAPHSIYQGIFKLRPATLLKLSMQAPYEEPELVEYWSLRAAAELGVTDPFTGTDQEAVEALENLLKDAVGRQMVADVPVGAFLSGGIDSSTIVALMQSLSSRPVRTFSIGFAETGYNEAPFAKGVANHLGTDHTELYMTTKEAQAVIPRLPSIWDEPFADSSQIPTQVVAALTRQHVTVSLSGDAGDELFGGYPRYFQALKANSTYSRVPYWLQVLMNRLPLRAYGAPARFVETLGASNTNIFRRWQAAARDLPYDPVETYKQQSMTHWREPEKLVLGAREPITIFNDRSRWADVAGLLGHLTYLDMALYLPEDILVKVDRAAMSVSLETRVPLLDHRVVEFAQRIPASMKIRNGQGKWLLRQVLHKYVPQELIERPKMGFGVPIDTWLRTDLRDWAQALLDEDRLRQEGIFDAEMVTKWWKLHLAGTVDLHYPLWDVLMFQAWYEYIRTKQESASTATPATIMQYN